MGEYFLSTLISFDQLAGKINIWLIDNQTDHPNAVKKLTFRVSALLWKKVKDCKVVSVYALDYQGILE